MLTGLFLIILFSYQLHAYLQSNEFVYEFPGDWDKPLGIAVGMFLIIRSLKFVQESRDLFIEISESHLIYRTIRSNSVRKIAISNIEKIQEKNEEVILLTKDLTELIIVDFSKVRIKDNIQESIKKSLKELN